MRMLILVVILGGVAVAICAAASWLGSRRPDSLGLAQLYRQFGLPNPALWPDWPERHFWANRQELAAIARYQTHSRPRA